MAIPFITVVDIPPPNTRSYAVLCTNSVTAVNARKGYTLGCFTTLTRTILRTEAATLRFHSFAGWSAIHLRDSFVSTSLLSPWKLFYRSLWGVWFSPNVDFGTLFGVIVPPVPRSEGPVNSLFSFVFLFLGLFCTFLHFGSKRRGFPTTTRTFWFMVRTRTGRLGFAQAT